ncbi:hypothetical protein EHQ43_01410 [Leptospira bouyouniensis]|uniref:Membrane-binding protein n=1 Tax=Leptospira bouyouniensis TaxID=2484911 RepID=A0A7I0HWT3_9LEPT|nr:hypothetical protein [Leptospira bouyouniensis]TGL09142.1 hypothetical protein EHQ43_01410 [Leptospira bouyouniensis]
MLFSEYEPTGGRNFSRSGKKILEEENLWAEGTFKEDKLNGKGKKYYFDNGKLEAEGIFKNGELNGKGRKYDFKSSKLEAEGTFEEGELTNDRWNGYDDKGYLVSHGIVKYERGIRFERNYYKGILKSEGTYDGKVFKGKKYYDNGNLEVEGTLENDVLNGKGKEYYYNGMLKSEGTYENGELNGKGKVYHENGKLRSEGTFERDELIKGIIYTNDGRKSQVVDEKGKLDY